MTDQFPERIYVGKWPHGGRAWREEPKEPHITRPFVPADTAIPKVEADAMVAAARMTERTGVLVYLRERQSCGWTIEELADVIEEGKHHAKQNEETRACAAFDLAVQEAVEAERERCAAMVDAKGQQWWQRTSGDDFTATDMADLAAAIRAPQETNK